MPAPRDNYNVMSFEYTFTGTNSFGFRLQIDNINTGDFMDGINDVADAIARRTVTLMGNRYPELSVVCTGKRLFGVRTDPPPAIDQTTTTAK